jgi:predicted nucleic acid-binding protein
VNTSTRPDIFFDSSALIAGVTSPSGAARALLFLAEAGRIAMTVSEQVITETERALARKAPQALPYYREALRSSNLRIVRDAGPEVVAATLDLSPHAADVPMLIAAKDAGVDYLVSLNRRHFIDDPAVAVRSGLRISTPGDALAWVKGCLTQR